MLHCQRWGTPAWRDYLPAYSLAADANQARDDLLTLVTSFIESSYLEMVPRSRNTFPKPTSAYKNWADVSRIHQRFGLPKLQSTQISAYVKALKRQYQDLHGFDALLERRKEPIRDSEHHHLLHLPDNTALGPFTYLRHSRFGLTWRALLSVLNYTGFRKAEWAVRARGEATHMTFAQLAWQLNNTPQRTALTAVQRAHIRLGEQPAFALIYPVPSKCDPDGSAFCNKGIPFAVDPDDEEAPGSLLLRLEELVSPEDRKTTPLFSDDSGAPFLMADMDRALKDALSLYDSSVATTRSWHSYRIRLASKLRAAVTPSGAPKYPDAVIQAFLRWKTPSSLRIYARYDNATYADILRNIQQVDISSIQYSNLPEISEEGRLQLLADTVDTELPTLLLDPQEPASRNKRRAPTLASTSAQHAKHHKQHHSILEPPSSLTSARAQDTATAAPLRLPAPQLQAQERHLHYFDRPSTRRPPVRPL